MSSLDTNTVVSTWSTDKSEWLRDAKYGLTQFLIGSENYELFGDIACLMKNSRMCRETWSGLGTVQSLQFFNEDSMEGNLREIFVIWRILNDCYDITCLQTFFTTSDNPTKSYQTMSYFMNYFQIDPTSPYYRLVNEFVKLAGAPEIAETKEGVADRKDDKATAIKTISKSFIPSEKYVYRLSVGNTILPFSTIANMIAYVNMYYSVNEYTNLQNNTGYSYSIDFGVDPKKKIYNEKYNVENPYIRYMFSNDIATFMNPVLAQIDPPPPSFLDEKTGELIPSGLEIRASSNRESLLSKLEKKRNSPEDNVYDVTNYDKTGIAKPTKLASNPIRKARLGNTFPLNRLVSSKDQPLGPFKALKELGYSTTDARKILTDVNFTGSFANLV